MEVLGYDSNKSVWGVVDNHDVEEPKDNDYIGLQEFGFNLFEI